MFERASETKANLGQKLSNLEIELQETGKSINFLSQLARFTRRLPF